MLKAVREAKQHAAEAHVLVLSNVVEHLDARLVREHRAQPLAHKERRQRIVVPANDDVAHRSVLRQHVQDHRQPQLTADAEHLRRTRVYVDLVPVAWRHLTIVVGVVLVSDENEHGAFGHAWADVREGGKCKVADAALFDMKDATIRYIPIGLLEDEGMGYSMDLMRAMRIWVERVVVLGR